MPPTDVTQEISKRLEEIRIQQPSLREDELHLKSRLNMMATINGSPVEIPARIFAFSIFASSISADYIPYSIGVHQYSFGVSNRILLRLARTCRYWRDIVYSTPALWCTIEVRQEAKWLRLCLVRSPSLDLDIVFHDNRFPSKHPAASTPR